MVHADCVETLTHASWGYSRSKTSLCDDLGVELSVWGWIRRDERKNEFGEKRNNRWIDWYAASYQLILIRIEEHLETPFWGRRELATSTKCFQDYFEVILEKKFFTSKNQLQRDFFHETTYVLKTVFVEFIVQMEGSFGKSPHVVGGGSESISFST